MAEPLITLLVACYNEQDNLARTLDNLTEALRRFHFSWEIIVADDGSTDRTQDVARDYMRAGPDLPIRLLFNQFNQGLGQTYIDGAFVGTGEYYRLVCGDGVEPIETFVSIFSHLGEADLLIPYYPAKREGSAFRRL